MPHYMVRTETQREIVLKVISALDVSKPWTVTVEREKRKRSLSQNALLHKWFDIIANETGDDAESVKHDFKMMFLPKFEHTSKITGEIMMLPIGTADLEVGPMSEFMNKVQAYATSQLGIILPADERY